MTLRGYPCARTLFDALAFICYTLRVIEVRASGLFFFLIGKERSSYYTYEGASAQPRDRLQLNSDLPATALEIFYKLEAISSHLSTMLDLKILKSALSQLEDERKIPQAKLVEAIEQALAAAYKKEYGKRGQIVRAHIDLDSGKTTFEQVKIVVDESIVRIAAEDEKEEDIDITDTRARYNEEHHIMLEDAKFIKADAKLEDEIVFPLEDQSDFGRIAAQTAKQVIIQKIREAEREAILAEFGGREGDIVSGFVQKLERGNVIVDFGRATGIIAYDEQIPGERYRRGERIRAYLFAVEDTPRGVSLRLSRTHPRFIEALFAIEAPEIASGVVEIRSIAREAGSRTKIAVMSNDANVDPVGSCVGQKGIRVTTVMSELGSEKIDIIPWAEDPATFVGNSLSPAKALDVSINDEEHAAYVNVPEDQLSLAIGKGGQNVRLAAKLTGWKIDIKGVSADGSEVLPENEEGNMDTETSSETSEGPIDESASETSEE